MKSHASSALVGHTGLVGSTLLRSRTFSATYNSRNISEIAGQAFDLLICAGAPASMWAANQDPVADKANLDSLATALASAEAKDVVLISTIAVFDDPSASYDEGQANFEVTKAYGRHRRALEERLQDEFPSIHVIRLPALFGKGLKKNFVFDLINPVPSFLRVDRLVELARSMDGAQASALKSFYHMDSALNMMALDRPAFDRSSDKPTLTRAVQAAGMHAAMFTNSGSRFQFYDLTRLAADIDRVIAEGIDIVNICSEPIGAGEIHAELTGLFFENHDPPIILEDVHSIHAETFGGSGPYLFDRDDTLARLRAFYEAETGQ